MVQGLSPGGARALDALERHGLLLLSDARLPSLVALVAGAPVKGSWWGHAKGGAIFAAATELEDHPDVDGAKLVSGKVTLVHRRLWPALLAVAQARAPWQTKGLDAAARHLLRQVDEAEDPLRTDLVPDARPSGRLLEARLLVHTTNVHTEKGAHAKVLESWPRWARRVRVKPAGEEQQARRLLEQALSSMAAPSGGRGRLPWQ
jgi:hypothetical protein